MEIILLIVIGGALAYALPRILANIMMILKYGSDWDKDN